MPSLYEWKCRIYILKFGSVLGVQEKGAPPRRVSRFVFWTTSLFSPCLCTSYTGWIRLRWATAKEKWNIFKQVECKFARVQPFNLSTWHQFSAMKIIIHGLFFPRMEVIMQPSASKRVELIIKTEQQQERASRTACSSIHANFSSEGHLSPSKKAKQKFQTMYMNTVSDKTS